MRISQENRHRFKYSFQTAYKYPSPDDDDDESRRQFKTRDKTRFECYFFVLDDAPSGLRRVPLTYHNILLRGEIAFPPAAPLKRANQNASIDTSQLRTNGTTAKHLPDKHVP